MTETKEKVEVDETLYNAFWSRMQQLRFDIFYYDEHFKSCILISRIIKYSIVAVTSLATGAWMSWNYIPAICIICGVIILLLQAFSAISEWLPFEKRKLELRELSAELDSLYIEMESDWRKIQALEIPNDEIRTLIQNYALRQADISKHYFKDDALPLKEKIRTKADNLTEEYFKYFI